MNPMSKPEPKPEPKPEVVAMYWLPHCSTCQKAEAHLKDLGVTIKHVHDVKATPITLEALDALINGIGGAEALFSKRAMKYRSMGLDQQTLSADDMRTHMHQEYTFIKRPALLLSDGRVLAGYSAKQYDAVFK
jgi:arsenate reductase (glutaredoxin)